MLVLTFFAFISGIVTILSPCILPVLPIVLSGSVGGKSRPWGIVTGFVLSFSIFTLALSALVQNLNIPPDSLRLVALVILVAFGLTLVIPRLQQKFEILVSRGLNRGGKTNKQREGFPGGLMIGASLGLVWTPCVGPILASVISLAITQSVDGGSFLIVLAYALGTSIPMTAVMLGGRKLIQRFPALTKNPQRMQRIFGVLMILVGLSIGFGLDRKFQSYVLEVFPQYGTGLTAIENTEPVQKALKDRRADSSSLSPGDPLPLSEQEPPRRARLGDYGPAPELVTSGTWLNSHRLPQGVFDDEKVTMEELRGKVVLVDFWTYSCINCVRTLPYLKAWEEAYGDEGLVILGVHSPEFAFERKLENLDKAMKDLGVTWPVVQDNRFRQWQAYSNRYWPAKYFIDAEGNIRYFHFGEGEYDESEEVIRKLLKEAGMDTQVETVDIPDYDIKGRTPETYLGYDRMEHFRSEIPLKKNEIQQFQPVKELDQDQWTLEGPWIFNREHILGEGILEMEFNARNVFLVVEPTDEGAAIEVFLDGEPARDTQDLDDGILQPDESRLYQLIGLDKAGTHRLKLRVQGQVKLYAFTFG